MQVRRFVVVGLSMIVLTGLLATQQASAAVSTRTYWTSTEVSGMTLMVRWEDQAVSRSPHTYRPLEAWVYGSIFCRPRSMFATFVADATNVQTVTSSAVSSSGVVHKNFTTSMRFSNAHNPRVRFTVPATCSPTAVRATVYNDYPYIVAG